MAGARAIAPSFPAPNVGTFAAILDLPARNTPIAPLERHRDPEPQRVALGRPVAPRLLIDEGGVLDHFYHALWRTEKGERGAVTRVVHYGDSPTTADLITGDIRSILQKQFGDAGHGFILAAPVAYHFGAGFAPVRKSGKLPWKTAGESYDLEYGSASLEIHQDAVAPGERVLVVDDVLATGGTAAAAATLVERVGGKVCGIACLIELDALSGRDRIDGHELFTLIHY